MQEIEIELLIVWKLRAVPYKALLIPRKISETALKFRAVSVIVAHDHPGSTLNLRKRYKCYCPPP
jgi:hypothetical protein